MVAVPRRVRAHAHRVGVRYNTLLVLVLGFAYGFMQPLIYTTELAAVQKLRGCVK